MRPERASCSAKLVAAARGLGVFLPPGLCALAPDPYGVALAGAPWTTLAAAMHRWPRVASCAMSTGPLHRVALGMALRTRELDDVLRRFIASGGRQIVLLGAGLDSRPWRLQGELPRDTRWFSVDHPATQAATRKALATALPPETKAGGASPDVCWVAHDFEQPMPSLHSALLQAGLDAASRILVIWEGVVMYLSEQALDASIELIRAVSCPGSVLALNFIPPECLSAPLAPRRRGTVHRSDHLPTDGRTRHQSGGVRGRRRLAAWLSSCWHLLTCFFSLQLWILVFLRLCNEPFLFCGWPHGELSGWLAPRGFRLLSDRSYADVADAMGAPPAALAMLGDGRFVALAERFVEAHRAAAPQDGPDAAE